MKSDDVFRLKIALERMGAHDEPGAYHEVIHQLSGAQLSAMSVDDFTKRIAVAMIAAVLAKFPKE